MVELRGSSAACLVLELLGCASMEFLWRRFDGIRSRVALPIPLTGKVASHFVVKDPCEVFDGLVCDVLEVRKEGMLVVSRLVGSSLGLGSSLRDSVFSIRSFCGGLLFTKVGATFA